MKYFFDQYENFYKTSYTGNAPSRLHYRHHALINQNKHLLNGQSVLDLASHDGRWTFSAVHAGAKKVVGIEGRKDLIDKARLNLNLYLESNSDFQFVHGDVFEECKKFEKHTFDVIFCFGLFYHIMNHMDLLLLIKNLAPKYLILDTRIMPADWPCVGLLSENTNSESNALPQADQSQERLVGLPSQKAIELMLRTINFNYLYYDWPNSEISDWTDLQDYQKGQRMAILAKNLTYTGEA